MRSETCFNVAQTFPIRHLRKCHDAELFTTTKTANTNILAIPRHDAIKDAEEDVADAKSDVARDKARQRLEQLQTLGHVLAQ